MMNWDFLKRINWRRILELILAGAFGGIAGCQAEECVRTVCPPMFPPPIVIPAEPVPDVPVGPIVTE